MQVIATRSAASLARGKGGDAWSRLSLYQDCPPTEVSLDDFELWAAARLGYPRLTLSSSLPLTVTRLLRTIEQLRARGLNDGDADYTHRLREAERRAGLSLVSEEAAEKDRVSHFILRLAYCRSEDLRVWFLAQETHLLRHRLEALSDAARLEFMRTSGVEYEQLTSSESAALGDRLQGLGRAADGGGLFKVPFTQALPLVAAREVLLVGGFAFVPLSRLVATIVAKVKSSHPHGFSS